MRLLAFSDLHRDLGQAAELAERSAEADVVVGAGDFASIHEGLEETIEALSAIECPALLVPGNNETEEALRSASAGWSSARVLHGQGSEIDGLAFFGLGAGVPVTPWDWSFDLSEEQAAEMLAPLAPGAVLISHSPPQGHCDRNSSGGSLGSRAVLEAAETKQPKLLLCGHVHESWGAESEIGPTRVLNLGPAGRVLEL